MIDGTPATSSLEQRYRKLLENIVDTVTIVGPDGRSTWTSAAARQDLGYTRSFWAGADLAELVHPDDRTAIAEARSRVIASPDASERGEVRLRHPDGRYSWVAYSAVNRLDDPDIEGIVITARPIGDEVAARRERADRESELQRALADRAAFIAGLSHEMRSPLHAIGALSELLLDSAAITGENRRQVESIHRSSSALGHMVGELLDYSKIAAERLDLLHEPMSPASVLDSVAEAHRQDAAAKGLAFEVTIDPAVPRLVLGDEHRLRQVIVNLVTNAIKYTGAGSIAITVDVAPAGAVRFAVSDTGPGIPEAAREHLFEPYTQARGSDTLKGTGLGLVITERLVTLMGGTLGFDSAVTGTTFTAAIPFEPAPSNADPTRRRRSGPTTSSTAHVLVVDDSEVNQLVARSQLERLGFAATIASSGAEALDLVADGPVFDAVLMDWHMPGMDGLETTERIRATEAGPGRLPIIATTASAMSGDRERCLAAGMDDYLPKPVALADLDAVLRRWTECAETDRGDGSTPEQPEQIERLVDELGDPQVVGTVISTFLEELPRWLDEIRGGIRLAGRESASRAAHSLKSTAALLGATELSAICARIEAAARDDAADLAPHISDVENVAEHARRDMSDIRDRLLSGDDRSASRQEATA